MTDQTIPAGLTREEAQAVREWAELALDVWAPDKPVAKAARVVLAALPTPTLADMTDKERNACRWMQCDYGVTERSQSRGVIGYFDYGEKKAIILTPACGIVPRDYASVTPRPDLPRMEWPGDTEVDTATTVPESTLAVGSEWGDPHALTRACKESGRDQITVTDKDDDVSVWGAGLRGWRISAPHADFAPFTVIHTGRKADQ